MLLKLTLGWDDGILWDVVMEDMAWDTWEVSQAMREKGNERTGVA